MNVKCIDAVTSQEAGNITATSETLIAVRSGHSPPVNTALLDSTPTRVRGDFVPESTTEPQPRHQAVDYLGQDQPRTTVVGCNCSVYVAFNLEDCCCMRYANISS